MAPVRTEFPPGRVLPERMDWGPRTRVAVQVTFLRMAGAPQTPARPLPPGVEVVRVPAPTLGFYRYLYAGVGHAHCWWLRRIAPDAELAPILRSPAIAIHVLYANGEPGGFYELDGRSGVDVNLAYFGLLPHMVGRRLGTAFLRHAVDHAWASGAGSVRVNTCTADHPRALPAYLKAGFVPQRTVRELWDIPDCLGMEIPAGLRA